MNTACSFCSRSDVELYTDGSSSICRVCATSAADRFGLPIIPLETIKTYKPNPACYTFAQQLCGVERHEFAMISANKSFGDIEAALALGMGAQLIRNPDTPETILDLVRLLMR